MKRLDSRVGKTTTVIIGVVLTCALVAWWWLFAWRLLASLENTDPRIIHGSRMLLYEGGTVFLLLAMGGLALAVYVYRDAARNERLRVFFSSFSHDTKTAIARLRLRSEVLLESNEFKHSPDLNRLVQDLDRLDLQLENSLLISGPRELELILENILLSQLLGLLRQEFPDLQLQLSQDVSMRGDRRALLSLLRNIFANSQHHGKATLIRIQAETSGGLCHLQIVDNGKGSDKDEDTLGRFPLAWTSPESGTGLGLYLCRILVERMGGRIQFPGREAGFTVVVDLPLGKGAQA